MHPLRARARAARRAGAAAALLLGLLLVLTGGAAAQDGGTGRVLRAEVTGPITPVAAAHVADAVAEAAAGDYAALVVALDTPGGLETSMRDIVQEALTAPVPVVVYVSPSGARAASAGAVITFAAHVAAMAPGTNIGAATPVTIEGGEVIDKVVNDSAAYVAAIAEERGRDVEFAVDTVRDGRSATANEALELGAIDLVVASLPELLDELDGTRVTLSTPGGGSDAVVLETAGAAVDDFDLSFTRSILQTLANPQLAFIFMSIAPLAILYEFISPSGGVGLIVGGILLVLGLFSLAVLPVNLVGVLLLVLAAALFAAELFAPGIGIFAAGGAVSLVLAGLFLFPRASGVAIGLDVLLPVALALAAVALVIGRFAVRSQRRSRFSGQGGEMVGASGTVRSVDGDRAQVLVSGALWRARSPHGQLQRGDAVRVVEMDGLELVVEPAQEQAQA